MHTEKHFTGSQMVRDIVIGMSDGLTVPFALTAGLSGAVDSNTIVVTAGLAEIVAGSIAMGLGGYLAGITEYQHYFAEKRREEKEVEYLPERERDEVIDVLTEYGVSEQLSRQVADELSKDKKAWVDFMMKFELNLEEPNPKAARKSAATIGVAYIIGGLIPLLGYIFTNTTTQGLMVSCGLTLVSLFAFGFYKSKVIGQKPFAGALKTVLIGVLASAIAFGVAKLFAA